MSRQPPHRGQRPFPCTFVVAAVALAASCGSNDRRTPAADTEDAGLRADAGAATSPQRPGNPSCLPPARVPESGTAGLPASLSQSGCFDPADPRRPLPALVPYEVNSPLWSDGAEKSRWLALPDGARITVQPDGDFDLPPGTVTIKTFTVDGRPVETRFFVRLAAGDWAGYTYEWNEAGTDAVVLDEGSRERTIGARTHYYPTRAECMNCHEKGAGFSLGLELAQLNRDLIGSGGRRSNQLKTWAERGLFTAPLPAEVQRLPALPSPADPSVPIAARARAYLHANCANCHRPESDGSGTIDLRYATALAATRTCNEEAVRGTLEAGVDARILLPGNPSKSILLVRMLELGRGRMPEFASGVVDVEATTLISSWIQSLTACP